MTAGGSPVQTIELSELPAFLWFLLFLQLFPFLSQQDGLHVMLPTTISFQCRNKSKPILVNDRNLALRLCQSQTSASVFHQLLNTEVALVPTNGDMEGFRLVITRGPLDTTAAFKCLLCH